RHGARSTGSQVSRGSVARTGGRLLIGTGTRLSTCRFSSRIFRQRRVTNWLCRPSFMGKEDTAMSLEPITDETTRQMRLAWFRFLDTVEPLRRDLHRYCLRLSGNLWAAEDLVQDTLLRAYAAMGRGDLHGEKSRM